MEYKVQTLREELDELGYYHTFTSESVPLVEKLVADLKTTTESLQKYITIAKNAIEERDNLQFGAEPYKCDNARLVKECNELHLTFLQFKEQNEKIQKDLKRRLECLKAENSDCNLQKEKLKHYIKQLEAEIINRGEILLNSKQKAKPTLKGSSTGVLLGEKTKKAKSFELNSAMALAEQKIANLSKEVKKLKEQNLQLIELNEMFQCQLNNRDKEIRRLSSLLEGGRPLHAIKKDCCCKKDIITEGATAIQDQLNKILQEKNILEIRLKECLAKQHEAMTRALHLAERNKLLEKEMKDIDHLALAVEAECNNTVRNNAEKVNRLQDQVNQDLIQIQNLERENQKLRQEKEEMRADLEAIGVEKKHLQTVLETSLEDKKRLQDRINNFTIIENDLNVEIDRLTRLSAEQKRKIAELESNIRPQKESREEIVQTVDYSDANRMQSPKLSPMRSKNKSKKKSASKRISESETPIVIPPPSALQAPANTPHEVIETARCTCCCDSCSSTKHLKELLEKELQHREEQANKCMDSLRSEKDYYMREYHKILEQLKNLPLRPGTNDKSDKVIELTHKLAEKEQILCTLQHENKLLSQEKFSLMSRLDSARDIPDTDGPCLKPNCKRTERERDLLRADMERLEEERDALKQKIRGMSDSQLNEQERLQKRLMEAEEQVHKLEQERRELVQSQGSRRATINTLEEQCDTLKDQLRTAQNELNQQRALYNQLKTLHEQTDLSLSDTQSKLVQAERELGAAMDNLKKRDLDRGAVNKEVEILKNDLQIMKSQLAQIDREKDEVLVTLDEKTEKLAIMEIELKSKEKTISSLESMVDELKKKLSMAVDETTNQEHMLRNSQTELASLRQELDTVKKIKDGAIQENRRLQDDLASVSCDCRDARKELELYKRQVDDLKTQLQHYVAEIKRTEDLISNKEIERNELLDQFRSLSHEANILESNNHTLENEASQSRVQLSVALDHASDLERKLENKESIIVSYEKQIADLTSQVASLEIQLRQYITQYERAEDELQRMREVILKLEAESARSKRQIRDRDDQRAQVDRNVDQLRSEREVLQQTASRDRRTAENIERDLHDAKHETHELRLLNQDLQEEVQRLKIQIQDLRDKLVLTSEQLDMYQEKALEYSQQNKQLRREVANERFRRSRDSESSKYPRPCFCDDQETGNFKQAGNKRDFGVVESRSPEPEKRCMCVEIRKNIAEYSTSASCKECCLGGRSGFQSCVTMDGRRVKGCIANYTLIHENHKVDEPPSVLKK